MSKKKKREKRRNCSVAATAKKRAETHRTGFENTAFNVPDDKKLFSLKSDKAVRLDVIPYVVGEGNPYADKGQLHYERTYWVHRSVGVDQTSFVCLKKTCNEPCPICDFRAKLMKDPDANEDVIKDLAPKERQLFNVIDTKDRDKGVQIWEMSFHLFGKKLDQEVKNSDEEDGFENFAELKGGFTLKCGIEERSFEGNSFFEVVSINFKPREKDYDEDILDETTCLDEILIVKEYDELKEIFLQTVGDDEDSEEDEEEGEGKGSKKKRSKDKDKEDEDDEDGTGESDDDSEDADNEDSDDEDSDDDDSEDSDNDDDSDDSDDEDEDTSDDDEDSDDEDSDDDDSEDSDDDGDDDESARNKKSKKNDGKRSKSSHSKGTKSKGKNKGAKSKDDKKSKKSKGKDKKNKCPAGGRFGKDTDELSECNDCPLWDKCDDA